MPELLVELITSLDGYGAADGESGTEALADMPKVVFSSTLHEPLSGANTRVVPQDAVEAVRDMKAKDRFRVVAFPVITGSTGQERVDDAYPMSPWR